MQQRVTLIVNPHSIISQPGKDNVFTPLLPFSHSFDYETFDYENPLNTPVTTRI